MQNGLLKTSLLSKSLEVVALVPAYDATQHVLCTEDQHTMNRTLLLWEALRLVLAPFTELDPDEDSPESFLHLGSQHIPGTGDEAAVNVYAVPFLWLAGSVLARCCGVSLHVAVAVGCLYLRVVCRECCDTRLRWSV